MITAPPTIEPHPAETTRSPTPVDFSQPVARPRKSAWNLFREVLDHGGPGYLQFAITNICNADCDFCGFARSKFDPKARRSVTLKEAQDVVEKQVTNVILHRDVHHVLRFLERHTAGRFGIKLRAGEAAEVAIGIADVRDGKLEITRPAVIEHFAEKIPRGFF